MDGIEPVSVPVVDQEKLALVRASRSIHDGGSVRRATGEQEEAARQQIADFLTVVELVNLSTVGAHGWPVTHCMHFASYFDKGQRPVIYMFTHDAKRKLANIAADPRVAVVSFNPRHEQGGPMPYLRMKGVAKIVEELGERDLAMQGQFNKVNYEFAQYLGLETQPAIRVDIVNAIWTPVGGEASFIDFTHFMDQAA